MVCTLNKSTFGICQLTTVRSVVTIPGGNAYANPAQLLGALADVHKEFASPRQHVRLAHLRILRSYLHA